MVKQNTSVTKSNWGFEQLGKKNRQDTYINLKLTCYRTGEEKKSKEKRKEHRAKESNEMRSA